MVNGAMEFSHLGIHVRDLGVSLPFYRDQLGHGGRRRVAGRGPVDPRGLDLPEASLKVALLRLPGTNAYVEIIEYQNVDWKPVDTYQANPGTCHVAMHVDDPRGLYERLPALGNGAVSRRVVPVVGGPLDGAKCVYMMDADGIRVEFLQSDMYLDTTQRDA